MPYDLNHWIKIRQHKTTYAVNKWDSTKEIMKNYLSVKKKKKKKEQTKDQDSHTTETWTSWT